MDDLSTAEDVGLWLSLVGFDVDAAAVTDGDIAELRRLRTAIRRVFAHVTNDLRPRTSDDIELPDALSTLNVAASFSPAKKLVAASQGLVIDDGSPPRDMASAMAALASDAIATAGGADRDKIRACYAPNCLHFFVARNPGREWCSPKCGNRARVARHYSRARAETNY